MEGCTIEEIFSYPDNKIFQDALLKYFDGKPGQMTLDILAQQAFKNR